MDGDGFLLTSLLDILTGSSRCSQTRGAQGEVWAKTPIVWLQDYLRVIRALGMESSQASSQSPRATSPHTTVQLVAAVHPPPGLDLCRAELEARHR